MQELERRLLPIAVELLGGFRALVVNGPRQAGKSTLVRHVQRGRGSVANLDDASLRDLAITDPARFVAQLGPRSAIDEFQRGGDPLLLALKMAIDADRSPGQYVLAGSTRFLTTRRLSETLTGRIGILELLPLSAGEIRGVHEDFIERAFAGDPAGRSEALDRDDYAAQIASGGFPELALGPATARFRSAWCSAYLETVTAVANVEQIADVRRPAVMSDLLLQIGARSAGEMVVADLSRESTSDETTVRSYVDISSTLYVVRLVPAWTTSHTNRSKRRPVMHLVDTALACHLVGSTADQLAKHDSPWFGPLLESYVVGELAKQAGWSERPVLLRHYRDRDQREVDVILERGRDIVGIEVKASSTPITSHAKHLAFLRDRVGERFKHGIVLHTGERVLKLGDRLTALPVSALWAA